MSLLSLNSLSNFKTLFYKRVQTLSFYFIRNLSLNPWVDDTNVGSVDIVFENGNFSLKTGKLAKFADGAVVAQHGNTSVLVTAVSKERQSLLSFMPLTVDYRLKASAAGRIPTNHMRRELGASEEEILTSRMIDRSVRPIFPKDFTNDTQIMCNVLAVDGVNEPDILSINAASAALSLSDIPWNGPIGAVRIGSVDGSLITNPNRNQMSQSSLNLILAALPTKKVVMIDASAENISAADFKHAVKYGVKEAQKVVTAIENLCEKCGKPKRPLTASENPLPEIAIDSLNSLCSVKLTEILTDHSHHKISRDQAIWGVRDEAILKVMESMPTLNKELLVEAFNKILKRVFVETIFEKGVRCDGREFDQLRKISCEVGLYPPLHGSALFQRGQTQVLSTVTFDSPESAMKTHGSTLFSEFKKKKFFLHYEFPPYATNDTGKPGSVGRREFGHGALAEKALRPVVPDNFQFTIRLTAEVLESNGSSSMASVCGGSLALMDAGVPISKPVSGVAIGLVTKANENGEIDDYRVLTDLLGIEDYLGDMDFKLAGSRSTVSALQADIKVNGLPLKIIMKAIDQGIEGKNEVLKLMDKCLSFPQEVTRDNRPCIEKLHVPVSKRAKFFGIGSLNLKRIMSDTGVSITAIDEENYQLFAPNSSALSEAKETIDQLLTEQKEPNLEFGAIYSAKITEIREFGVMVQLYDKMSPTLVHNSQLAQKKISHPSVLGLKVNDDIMVKYFGRDPVNGQMRLSRKILHGPVTSVMQTSAANTTPNSTPNNESNEEQNRVPQNSLDGVPNSDKEKSPGNVQ